MDAHKQIRANVISYRSTIFKLDEVVIRPCHFDSQAPLFEQPGHIESNRQIDAFFVKTEYASRAGVFAAMPGIYYNGPRQSASPWSWRVGGAPLRVRS